MLSWAEKDAASWHKSGVKEVAAGLGRREEWKPVCEKD
jgi:hypothetical protein